MAKSPTQVRHKEIGLNWDPSRANQAPSDENTSTDDYANSERTMFRFAL